MASALHDQAQAAIDAYQAALDSDEASNADLAAKLAAALAQVDKVTADDAADKAQIADLQAKLAAVDPGVSPAWGTPSARDEFGTALDTKLWTPASGAVATDTDGYRSPANVLTADGRLVLRSSKRSTPIKVANGSTRAWDSAWVDMNFSQRYGRWEIRYQSLKPLVSRGMWVGPWLRADGAGGEADISESTGTPNLHGTIYTPDGAATSSTFYTQTGTGTVGVDRTANLMWNHEPVPVTEQTSGPYFGWHTAALEWTPQRMTVLEDGVKKAEIDRSTKAGVSVLDKGFPTTAHLRYTAHVGSTWIGSPDANTLNPYDTLVDYVRVYSYAGQQ